MSIGMREAFEADHEESSRAMTTNIAEKLSDYDKFFDKITYEKGSVDFKIALLHYFFFLS